MRRALTEKQIAEIEARANLPVEGTYAALQRGDYPTLNAVTDKCSDMDVLTAMRNFAKRMRDEGDDELAGCIERMANSMAIPESDLIQ